MPAPDGRLWKDRKVPDYLSELLERTVSRQQGWWILKQLDFSLKVPRPFHQQLTIIILDFLRTPSKVLLPAP